MTNRNISTVRSKVLMFAAAGALLAGAANIAMAQDLTAPGNSTEEVIVQAPYIVHGHFVGTQKMGEVNKVALSVSRQVRYSDLDLSRDSDIDRLEHRINDAAREDCKELAVHYPLAQYPRLNTGTDCVQEATDNAMMRMHYIIAQQR